MGSRYKDMNVCVCIDEATPRQTPIMEGEKKKEASRSPSLKVVYIRSSNETSTCVFEPCLAPSVTDN